MVSYSRTVEPFVMVCVASKPSPLYVELVMLPSLSELRRNIAIAVVGERLVIHLRRGEIDRLGYQFAVIVGRQGGVALDVDLPGGIAGGVVSSAQRHWARGAQINNLLRHVAQAVVVTESGVPVPR